MRLHHLLLLGTITLAPGAALAVAAYTLLPTSAPSAGMKVWATASTPADK